VETTTLQPIGNKELTGVKMGSLVVPPYEPELIDWRLSLAGPDSTQTVKLSN